MPHPKLTLGGGDSKLLCPALVSRAPSGALPETPNLQPLTENLPQAGLQSGPRWENRPLCPAPRMAPLWKPVPTWRKTGFLPSGLVDIIIQVTSHLSPPGR